MEVLDENKVIHCILLPNYLHYFFIVDTSVSSNFILAETQSGVKAKQMVVTNRGTQIKFIGNFPVWLTKRDLVTKLILFFMSITCQTVPVTRGK